MKKVFVIVVAVALLVGITALAYGAAPEKVTGGVGVNHECEWQLSFNAHEGSNKGQLTMTSNKYGWVLKCVVTKVQVEPDAAERNAWFAAKCIKDSGSSTWPSPPDKFKDQYVVFKVHDGGKPKDAADTAGWKWFETQGAAEDEVGLLAPEMWDVVRGNLVIHP